MFLNITIMGWDGGGEYINNICILNIIYYYIIEIFGIIYYIIYCYIAEIFGIIFYIICYYIIEISGIIYYVLCGIW